MSVIRQVKQKSGENSFNSYQLGAKASNVKMLDELDLQRSLIVGNYKKTVTISVTKESDIGKHYYLLINVFGGQYLSMKQRFIQGTFIKQIYYNSNNEIKYYNYIFIDKTSTYILNALSAKKDNTSFLMQDYLIMKLNTINSNSIIENIRYAEGV